MAQNITPRAKDYPQWYLDVIAAADLADYAPVKGCMVIKPQGYAIWERLQSELDGRFKATGHVNAYFPLFIPVSFLAKEAKHVEGFAMECAVVTHSGLAKTEDGGLKPKGALEEPLVVRPTSETVIGHMWSKWVQSWRDLPILMNQWANIVRWEMRTRLFLRTMEFLWQEGHTAHETRKEAEIETLKMLDVYAEVAESVLAIPVLKGRKSESERFAGADDTYCIEALMQDGKALQAGTSHFLGQNFSKAFDVKFQTRDQKQEHVWTTSWGVSTRLIGALIMTHSDDEGLVLPPKTAPVVCAVVPIYRKDEEKDAVLSYAKGLVANIVGLEAFSKAEAACAGREILEVPWGPVAEGRRIVLDLRDGLRPPEKFFWWEQRGVPLRVEAGPKDLQNQASMTVLRHDRTKQVVKSGDLSPAWLDDRLDHVQKALFDRALERRTKSTFVCDSYETFKKAIDEKPGFYLMHWDGDAATEAKVKAETKATIRCLPLADELPTADGIVRVDEPGTDPVSGKPSKRRVVYARAY
jgi:prolyl-tRNA synthetase